MDELNSNIVNGPEIPMKIPDETLGQFMLSKLRSHEPYDVLMREAESGRTSTAAEFLRLSIRVAESLGDLGMCPGDVVALLGTACIDIYIAATGVLLKGGIVAPMDHTMDREMLKEIFIITQPKFVFCEIEVVEKMAIVLNQLKNSARVIILNFLPVEKPNFMSFKSFLKYQVNFEKFRAYSSKTARDDVAFLVCSSGTTGFPKPVMITNKGLLYQVIVWSFISSLNKILSCPAITFSYFFWISGVFLYAAAVCLNFEMTIVQKIEPEHVLKMIERHKPIWGLFSPALVNLLTNYSRFKYYNVSSLSLMITGGCSLQKVLVQKIKELWGANLACRQSYGMTEVAGTATTSGLGDDVLSVGKLIPGFQMKIISRKDGKILSSGQKGEIFLRSPSIMKGYLKNVETTREVLKDNWYRTGDIGFYTDEGLIYITGRVKDFINFNEVEVSVAELEERIVTTPGVADAGVVGIKIDHENSVFVALIVKTKDSNLETEDIIKKIRENLLEHKEFCGGVYFVDTIPRTSSGKMKRFDLQNVAESLYKEKKNMIDFI